MLSDRLPRAIAPKHLSSYMIQINKPTPKPLSNPSTKRGLPRTAQPNQNQIGTKLTQLNLP